MKLYVKINEHPAKIYSETEALNTIKDENESVLLPNTMTDSLYDYFGFYPVKIIHNKLNDTDLERYSIGTAQTLKQNPNTGEYELELKYDLSDNKLNEHWTTVKQTRNNFLSETDWIETSELIDKDCRQRYKVWRQLVRDVLVVADYPYQVIFPNKPELIFTDDIEENKIKNNRLIIDEFQVEQLKDYAPNKGKVAWLKFLLDWQTQNFTNDKLIVSNLILLHTDTTLEKILVSKH